MLFLKKLKDKDIKKEIPLSPWHTIPAEEVFKEAALFLDYQFL